MALRLASMRNLPLMPALPRPVYQSGEGPRFDADQAVIIAGTVQPLASQTEAAVYGERAKRMLLLLTSPDAPLAEGMGLCVDTLMEDGCDYRIAAPPERWRTHQRAVLERVW